MYLLGCRGGYIKVSRGKYLEGGEEDVAKEAPGREKEMRKL